MRDRSTKGSQALLAIVDESGLRPGQVAAALNTSRATVLAWLDETKQPAAYFRAAIEVWTGGRIRQDAWLTKTEQAQLAAIIPFVAAN